MRRLFLAVPVVAILMTLSGCGVNTIPTEQQQVQAAWSQVLNEYQRRTDLIPNLVATVKGYARHERRVLTEVTRARSRVTATPIPADVLTNPQAFHAFEHNQAQLGSALSRLMVVTENYPNLKADQNFLTLQSQLEGTENRIAVARRDYIRAVQRYNTELTTYPGRWWAELLYKNAHVMQNFSISHKAMAAPQVHF
ncbi:MAG TPA: LemA family protein [Acidiferrobacteraceae bacterium]|nr:LemA family protein [Acidiferrobacteraceae bacterium]